MRQVREAIEKSSWKPQNTILFQRDELFQSLDKSLEELNWNQLAKSMRTRRGLTSVSGQSTTPPPPPVRGDTIPRDGLKREMVPGEKGGYVEIGEAFPSEDPQYIIYTSGLCPPHSHICTITN